MLNQQVSMDLHPLPKLKMPEGGQHFSKIDLADAYIRLELDEQAQKLCVINTQFGLFDTHECALVLL